MFKRVDRRRKRKEIEESLGLDEDETGVFGLHDTDSSESESDSSESASDSPSSGTSSDGHDTQSRKKRKRGAPPTFFDESDRDEDGEPTINDEEDEEGGSDHSPHPPLTIASALKEPIRPVCAEPEGWECALCPGKVLKHTAMVKVHETSRIHRRRFKRIQELAMEFSPDDDIQTVLAKSTTETQPQPNADNTILSRRAEERKAKQAKLKERRKKFKERKVIGIAMVKAKKAAKTAEKETTAGHPSDADEATQASKRLKIASSESPKGIKNMHRTSVPAEAKKILIKGGRKNKKEITKIPTPRGKEEVMNAQ